MIKSDPRLQRSVNGEVRGPIVTVVGEGRSDLSQYLVREHEILVHTTNGLVNRGVLGEEVLHALDSVSGFYQSTSRLRDKVWKAFSFRENPANDWWHVGVFRRLASELESATPTPLRYFLDPSDAAGFRRAADETEVFLPQNLQGFWDPHGVAIRRFLM